MTIHTWLNRAAAKLMRAAPFSDASRGSALIGLMAGLAPDSIQEQVRQALRASMATDGVTPADVLVHLLWDFRLLGYRTEAYSDTIARIRDEWATHERGGTVSGVVLELERAGYPGCVVHERDPDDNAFRIGVPGVTEVAPVYGAGSLTYGGFVYGMTLTGITAADIAEVARVTKHWKNARRYAGVGAP